MTAIPAHQIVLDVSTDDDERSALRAAAAASIELDVQLVVVGPERDTWRALRTVAHDAERIRVLHAPPSAAGISSHDQAVLAGLGFLRDHPSTTLISASPTSLLVRRAREILEPLPTVKQPALAAVVPTLTGHGRRNDPFALLLDVGATVKCSDGDLVRFATMGAAYARLISANERPRLGILAGGHTAQHWPKRVRQADQWLAGTTGPFEYVGVVRADEVTRGLVDVVITDGFTGDVLLRTLEGVAVSAEALVDRAREKWRFRMGFSMLGGPMERLRELADWENYGGTPLLGFRRSIIVTHQRSTRRSFYNAIRLAQKVHRLQLLQQLDTQLLAAESHRPADLMARA
jgi:glycerol-3-phosphate acyltransferase PlsX